LVLGALFFVVESTTKPFLRIVHPEDWYYYSYPFTVDEAVPNWLLIVIVIVVPVVVVAILIGCVQIWKKKFTEAQPPIVRDCCYSFYSYTLALILTLLFTAIVKRSYGNLRPDYLSRCFPEGWKPEDLVSIPLCAATASEEVLVEGRLSFPSGHASSAFVCFTFCALYSFSKLHSLKMASLPLVVASGFFVPPLLIAISRTSDYRHHFQDVIAGSIIGVFIAVVCYRFYYPFCYESHRDVADDESYKASEYSQERV